MKALTLRQPWASLIAAGAKRVETRSWSTSHRGLLAIHSGKAVKDLAPLRVVSASSPMFRALVDFYGEWDPAALPLGFVVAVAQLVDVVPVGYRPGQFRPPPQPERGFGDYGPGQWAWLLENVRPLRPPLPCWGSQGLWDWRPPRRWCELAEAEPA